MFPPTLLQPPYNRYGLYMHVHVYFCVTCVYACMCAQMHVAENDIPVGDADTRSLMCALNVHTKMHP